MTRIIFERSTHYFYTRASSSRTFVVSDFTIPHSGLDHSQVKGSYLRLVS